MESGGGRQSGDSPADRYERLYPGTGLPEAQKQERMERMDFKSEAQQGRRTTRTRGVLIPEIPWHRKDDE